MFDFNYFKFESIFHTQFFFYNHSSKICTPNFCDNIGGHYTYSPFHINVYGSTFNVHTHLLFDDVYTETDGDNQFIILQTCTSL